MKATAILQAANRISGTQARRERRTRLGLGLLLERERPTGGVDLGPVPTPIGRRGAYCGHVEHSVGLMKRRRIRLRRRCLRFEPSQLASRRVANVDRVG